MQWYGIRWKSYGYFLTSEHRSNFQFIGSYVRTIGSQTSVTKFSWKPVVLVFPVPVAFLFPVLAVCPERR